MLENLLVIGNNKGGAKKSTLTAELAGEMWGAGWRVLVVDLDEQGDLGKRLFWRDTSGDDQGESLHRAMLHGDPLTSLIEAVGDRDGFDALPGGSWALALSTSLRGGSQPVHDLESLLAPLAPNYDMILVDTQPSTAEPLHLQALQAARFVLSPVNRDEEDSLERYVPAVARIKERWNPELHHLGAVSYGFVRGNMSSEYLDRLERTSGIKAYRTPIHHAPTAVTYCRLARKLVHEYALAVEETLHKTGSSYGVGQAGLNISVAGKSVNKTQRAKLPPDAPVIGDVLLGGGLAGDYFALGRAVMADVLEARGVAVDVDPPPVIDLTKTEEGMVAV